MTTNQLAYWKLEEDKRAAREQEKLKSREVATKEKAANIAEAQWAKELTNYITERGVDPSDFIAAYKKTGNVHKAVKELKKDGKYTYWSNKRMQNIANWAEKWLVDKPQQFIKTFLGGSESTTTTTENDSGSESSSSSRPILIF